MNGLAREVQAQSARIHDFRGPTKDSIATDNPRRFAASMNAPEGGIVWLRVDWLQPGVRSDMLVLRDFRRIDGEDNAYMSIADADESAPYAWWVIYDEHKRCWMLTPELGDD